MNATSALSEAQVYIFCTALVISTIAGFFLAFHGDNVERRINKPAPGISIIAAAIPVATMSLVFLAFGLNLAFIGVLILYLIGACFIAGCLMGTLKADLYNTPRESGAGVLPYWAMVFIFVFFIRLLGEILHWFS